MHSEIKICENCKNPFTIEPEDFAFYEKIHVPPPTWCPECRMVRRSVWLNGRTLYKRTCDAPGHSEDIISKYAPEKPVTVYDASYWLSDAWDPMRYGRAYEFSRPFFEQFVELMKVVPVRNLDIVNSVNCDYCPSVTHSKDCYLVSGGYMAQDCLYAHVVGLSKQVVDSIKSVFSDTLYGCYSCTKCFNVRSGIYSSECMDCQFLYDCRNCSNCFGCVGLRNKQYHIFNKPYAKKYYQIELAKYDSGSFAKFQKTFNEFIQAVHAFPKRHAILKNAVDCTGDDIEQAKRCQACFDVRDGIENCKYVLLGGRGVKDSYDVCAAGVTSELLYEVSGGTTGSQRVFFSTRIRESANIFYSRECSSSAYLFGCVGLQNKRYCILNRQYSKEAYAALVQKIIEHMHTMPYSDERGSVYGYGEFFPLSLAPFAYNESEAQEYFPLTKAAILSKGYTWRDSEKRAMAITITYDKVSDHIKDVSDSITREVIGCACLGHDTKDLISETRDGLGAQCGAGCTTAFRVIPQEFAFYKKMKLPLPRLCPNCRFYELLCWRNPIRLWRRRCMCLSTEALAKADAYRNSATHRHGAVPCLEEFETSYSPERPEIVYCENCYNQEVA